MFNELLIQPHNFACAKVDKLIGIFSAIPSMDSSIFAIMNGEVYFTDIKRHIMGHLEGAETSIKLAVSWLTDREIFNLLLRKLSEGVEVSLVTRNDYLNNHPDALTWNEFIRAGGKLCFSRDGEQLHYKFILADDKTVLCTSYNLCCFAIGNNRENVMLFRNPEFVTPFVTEFDYLLSTLDIQDNVVRLRFEDVSSGLHGFYESNLENDRNKQSA